MITVESLYNLFGVQHACTDEELRKAYCQLISNFHPDRNPRQIAEATAKTQELNAAYQELKRRRSIQRPGSNHVNNGWHHTGQFGFECRVQFGIVLGGIDLDAIVQRKAEFQKSWQRFRENPTDPIYALLFINASFEAERQEYVKTPARKSDFDRPGIVIIVTC